MPARRQASTTPTLRADFGSVWSILDSKYVSYESQGLYSYTGTGKQEDVGVIKTKFPLDPNRSGGIASFEITLTEAG
jgi:hypothetical protein